MACPHRTTADGIEMQFGTNHLGHFLLVNRLMPAVLAADGWWWCPRRATASATSTWTTRIRRPPLRPVGRLRPVEDRQRAVRGRARPPPARPRRACHRAAPGRHHHRAGSPPDRRVDGELLEARGPEMGWKSGPRGGDLGVGRVVAEADEVGGRYCEDCAVAPVIDDADESPAACATTRSTPTPPRALVALRAMVGETLRVRTVAGGHRVSSAWPRRH